MKEELQKLIERIAIKMSYFDEPNDEYKFLDELIKDLQEIVDKEEI